MCIFTHSDMCSYPHCTVWVKNRHLFLSQPFPMNGVQSLSPGSNLRGQRALTEWPSLPQIHSSNCALSTTCNWCYKLPPGKQLKLTAGRAVHLEKPFLLQLHRGFPTVVQKMHTACCCHQRKGLQHLPWSLSLSWASCPSERGRGPVGQARRALSRA